ncbi:MAG: ABC transporter ATP-binding protein [Candidatus Bathyarchaeota archaeon]|nr:ABC transporter ATP-binding protein [Candidatus Bathyarchaeota archaeon]
MIQSAKGADFVVVKNLSKNYGRFRALDNISFTIKQGEIFGYIGPNGAGKTTTMKILVDLIGDFEGEAFIGGYQVGREKTAIHRLLGYLPQNVAFQEWRTINHALITFGKLSGLNEQEVEDRIPKILNLLGLAELRQKKISQLSGGMIQKVGLAQALLHEPKFLVLDEPLGGLDPLSRYQFKEIVLKLKNQGTTILFSSHILSDVQDVADRIGIISHGRIKQIGTLKELKARLQAEKTIEVLLSGGSDKWNEIGSIHNIKGVTEPSPGSLLVHLESDADENEVFDELIQLIAKLKIRVHGIQLLSPSLDQIYLNYVQEEQP